MSQRRASIHNRCPKCRINNRLCVCEHIRPLSITTRVSVIVHVRELTRTSNTAQFVKHMIPNETEIFIRGRVFDNFTAAPVMERPGMPLFLYPHDDSEELNADFLVRHPGPFHLIVPDGNWHQARKVRQREAAFQEMRAVKLPSGILSEYRLRRAPQPEWVSTYEAIAHALGVLEGPQVREDLMTFFRHWVKTTLYNRSGLDPSFEF